MGLVGLRLKMSTPEKQWRCCRTEDPCELLWDWTRGSIDVQIPITGKLVHATWRVWRPDIDREL